MEVYVHLKNVFLDGIKTQNDHVRHQNFILFGLLPTSWVKAAAMVLTSDINNATDILSKINNLCAVDVPCQSNAESCGT